jgi:2-methylcitrate dehydratase PrpD
VLARDFGEFVSRLRPQALPPDVAVAAKLRVLDTLGAALAGVALGNLRVVAPLLETSGSARVWGQARTRSPREAALANSFATHSTYLEDGSRFTGGHPSSVVIPAAIAAAEARHSSGAALLAAIAAGYEVFLRLGRAIYPATVVRGFQSTAILGAPSSAAACASLGNFAPEASTHAIAIACSLGAGLKEALKSSASQPIQVARSCEAGMVAAAMAQAGSEGAPSIVEKGFLPAFAGTGDPEKITQGLGREFRIGETYLKRHAGCRGNHAPIDAALELVRMAAIAPADIRRVRVWVDTVTRAAAIEPPANREQAQFSIGFAVAIALLEGDASIFRYSDALLEAPATRAMMALMEVKVDPALDAGYPDKRGAAVEIETADGRVLRHAVDIARGEPEWPLTMQDVEEKFMRLAAPVLGIHAGAVRDIVMGLETLDDVATLTRLLEPEVAP